jgi:site-specific DNA-methyltransferase (adenine-specific)
MPKQKPATSKQDYGTPAEFLAAVWRRFGPIDVDLAAHVKNTVCSNFVTEEDDSLSLPWHEFEDSLLWLNPPFNQIRPWAKKCAEEAALGARILFLVPASVGTNWYWDHVAGSALVECLSPRLSFDGCPVNPKTGKVDPFPKDLMLCQFGFGSVGFSRWQWKQ